MDASLELFAALRDPARSLEQRRGALERLLSLACGWWGRGSLQAHATNVARGQIPEFLDRPVPESKVDPEECGIEAILVLFDLDAVVDGPPGPWLRGIIKNKVGDAIRRSGGLLFAGTIGPPDPDSEDDTYSHDVPDPNADIEKNLAESDPELVAKRAEFERAVREKFEALLSDLSPSEAIVVRMRILDEDREPLSMTHDEVALTLRITPDAARKRWSRAMQKLKPLLQTVQFPTPPHPT
jgi:DNA-directed RNA polymerase specialized sigma24 family protein